MIDIFLYPLTNSPTDIVLSDPTVLRVNVIPEPPLEYMIGWGRGIPDKVTAYYDAEIEEREVMKVLRAFLKVVS